MIYWKRLKPLVAPALATLPLAFAPQPLLFSVGKLVALAWVGLPLCAFFRVKGLLFSLILIAGLAFATSQYLNDFESYWIFLCALSLGVSLIVYLFLSEEAKPQVEVKEQETQSTPVVPDPELLELRKQVQNLVPWQYRAIEAEQALEQERYQLSQCRSALLEAEEKLKTASQAVLAEMVPSQPADIPVGSAMEDNNDMIEGELEELRAENGKLLKEKELFLEELNKHKEQFERLSAEHADLVTCYRHLNNEMQSWQQKEMETVENETVETPQDLLKAWQEADREHRRIKGMFNQLREQFELQSRSLEEARKERFHFEEALGQQLIKQREIEMEDSALQLKAWEKLTAALSERDEEIAALEKLLEEQTISSRV